MINFYNRQQHAYQQAIKQNPDLSVEDFIDTDPTKISWTRSLRNSIRKKQDYVFRMKNYVLGFIVHSKNNICTLHRNSMRLLD